MFRIRNSQKFIMGDEITADMKVNSEYTLCLSQSCGMKSWKEKMSPFYFAKNKPLDSTFYIFFRPRSRAWLRPWASLEKEFSRRLNRRRTFCFRKWGDKCLSQINCRGWGYESLTVLYQWLRSWMCWSIFQLPWIKYNSSIWGIWEIWGLPHFCHAKSWLHR